MCVYRFAVNASDVAIADQLKAVPDTQLMGAAVNQSATDLANSKGSAASGVVIGAAHGYLSHAWIGVRLKSSACLSPRSVSARVRSHIGTAGCSAVTAKPCAPVDVPAISQSEAVRPTHADLRVRRDSLGISWARPKDTSICYGCRFFRSVSRPGCFGSQPSRSRV